MDRQISYNPVKTDKQLVKFHRNLINKYIKEHTNLEFRKRLIVLSLYDNRINHNNIRYYFNAKITIFLSALLTERLDEIKSYYKAEKPTYISDNE